MLSLRRALSRSKYTLPLQNTTRRTCCADSSSVSSITRAKLPRVRSSSGDADSSRSEEHTSELQSQSNLVCRLLLEKKKNPNNMYSVLTHCWFLVTLFILDRGSLTFHLFRIATTVLLLPSLALSLVVAVLPSITARP